MPLKWLIWISCWQERPVAAYIVWECDIDKIPHTHMKEFDN